MKELSQKEVADHLGLSEKTVEKHLRTGARLLAHYTRTNALMPRLPKADLDELDDENWDMSSESTQAIEEAASAWLIRRDSRRWTPADEARLHEWLDASSLHRVAFWRLEMAWEESARLKALGAGIASDRPPPRGEWNLTPFFESRDEKVAPDEEGATGVETDVRSDIGDESERLALIGREIAAAGLLPPRRVLRREPGRDSES